MVDLGLQCRRQPHGLAKIHLGHDAGGVRDRAGDLIACEEDNRRSGKQLVAVLRDELDRNVQHRDDRVEPLAAVFQSKKITKSGLVLLVGESSGIQVLRVEVQSPVETFIERPWQVTFPGEGNDRLSTGRVENQDPFLLAL